MDAVFLKIVNMSIAASWVVLAVLVLRYALKKAPKWISVALWALVAVRLVCPFSFESVLSLIPSTDTIPQEIVYAREPVIDSGVEIINETLNPVITGSLAPKAMTSVNPVQVYLFIGGIVWTMGIVLMVLHALISYLRLRSRVAPSICLTDKVCLCDYIDSPFILGVIKPKIYLPSAMDPNGAAHVLAHERAHIQRRDHWWKPLGFALLSIHWFNPVMWLAYILLCRDIEMACDEKVVREMDIPDKKAYSEALLRCSVSRRMIAACPLAFGEVGVKERVKSVLSYRKPAFWIVVVAVIALIVAAVCFLTDPVADIKGQRKFDLPGPNVADLNVHDILTNIRKYEGLEKNANPYVNDYINDAILRENFDLGLVHIPYFADRDGKTWLSIAVFSDLAESCTLDGQFEWEEQTTRFLLEHYLNALKYMPQAEISAMLSNPEHYRIRFVEEGTPGSYDRVIRYSDQGVGATDGWLIHLEVIPAYYENGGFPETGEESVHLFYGESDSDVNGVVMDAKILEISNKAYLVEPVPGSWELSSADKIWVQMELDDDLMPQEGDIIRITYDGNIMESYPAQLGEVFRIRLVSDEYNIHMQSTSFVYHVDENGVISDDGDINLLVQKAQVFFNDNTKSPGYYFLESGETEALMDMLSHIPENAIQKGAAEESYDEYLTELVLSCIDTDSEVDSEITVDLFYTKTGVNLKFWRTNSGGTSVMLDSTYCIHDDQLTEYMRSLCDRSRSEGSINIRYPDNEYVEYVYGDASIRLMPLVGWEYEIVPYTDDDTPFGIRCRPEWGEEGWIFVSHWPGGFAVCGTGLQTEETDSYVRGFYDGSNIWSFHRYTCYPGDYVVINEGADDWIKNAEMVFTMIDFGGLAEVSVQPVSYSYCYINMEMDIWKGWEYEITEYSTDTYNCGIRFRPEGEEGWLNLQWGSFSVPKEDRTVKTRYLGHYIVEEGSYRGEPAWRYLYFKEAPDHYTLWNEGADSWLLEKGYQDTLQQMLQSIRVADGVVWKEELLSKIKFKLLWYDYDDLYASMNQYTGVWWVGLRRDDGTWTNLDFDQEGNLLSSAEGFEAPATEAQ